MPVGANKLNIVNEQKRIEYTMYEPSIGFTLHSLAHGYSERQSAMQAQQS